MIGIVIATTPAQIVGKPSIYDNWDTSVYEDGLVAFYRFDNESAVGENNTHVYDWSGGINNGTIIGDVIITLTNGLIGGTLEFEGIANDYVNSNLNMKNIGFRNLTLLFWFNAKSIDGDFRDIFKSSGWPANSDFDCFIKTGEIQCHFKNETGASIILVDNSISIDNWIHVVIRNNGTDLALFINNILISSETIRGTIMNASSTILIGGDAGANNFNGSIDEIMIFNRSLSILEISEIYTQQKENKVKAYEDMTLISDTNLLQDTYYLNDTNTDGVIKMLTTGVTLDCNGATLIGNYTPGGSAIEISGTTELTIKNCNITKYGRLLDGAGSNNIIINNTFSNSSNQNIFISGDHVIVENNSFQGGVFSSGVFSSGRSNITVRNNIVTGRGDNFKFFISASGTSSRWLIENNNLTNVDGFNIGGSNHIIRNNILQDGDTTLFAGFHPKHATNISYYNNTHMDGAHTTIILNSTYIRIENNTYYNNTAVVDLSIIENSTNITINNNTFTITDKAIETQSSSNINITNNELSEIRTGVDSWHTGIHILSNSINILIDNNEINTYGVFGILIGGSKNITISNNNFTTYTNEEKDILNINSFYGISSAIAILQNQRYWTVDGDSTESITDDRSRLGQYNSTNITIANNSFGSKVRTFLRTQGSSNISHDLIDHWYRSFQFPIFLLDKEEMYNNNLFDSLTTTESSGRLANNFIRGYPNVLRSTDKFNYTISKTLMTFKNVNQTTAYNISIFNLTDQPTSQFVQIFNQTSDTPTAENVNEFNQTIPAGNRTLVFSYESNTQPIFTSIATTTDITTYSYSPTDLRMNFNCTGTGNIVIQGLNHIKGSHGLYTIIHDGATIGTDFNSDSFTVPSCSSWEFLTNDTRPASSAEFLIVALSVLVATFLIVFAVTPLLNETTPTVIFFMTLIVIVIVGIVIMQFLLNGVG